MPDDLQRFNCQTDLIPLFQGKLNSDKVAQKWKKVLANANFYKYAEQQGFGGVFKNWPNSKYFSPFGRVRNNSNVFGRWLVNTSGMGMQEIGARNHPPEGQSVPKPVNDYNYHGTPYK